MAELQVPSIDFSPLGQLPQVYKSAQDQRTLADVGRGLADGSLDYKTAAGQIASTGNLGATYQFLQLAEAKDKVKRETEAGNDFTKVVSGYFGGQPAASPAAQPVTAPSNNPVQPLQPQMAVPQATAPQPMNRPPVASSPKVWGDAEAEAAGLYEPKSGQPPMTLAALGTSTPTPGGPLSGVIGMPGQSSAPQAIAPAGPSPASPQAASPRATPSAGQVPIPVLIQAMTNPNMPSGQKEVAGKLLTRALDESKPNDKIQYLQQLKDSSGFQGTPLELEMQLRRASKTDVNTVIDQKGETEEAKAAGKAAGERRATMFASAGAASKTLQNLSRTESLLNQVSQGKLSPATYSVSSWAKALGMNDDVATSLGLDPKGVGSAQALQSLVNESVIGKIGAGGFPANNFSDADREFITGIFPRLGDDPQANKIRIEGARRMANLDLQRARDYQAWKKNPNNKGKGFEDFETDWSDKISKQDVFGDLRKQSEALVGAPRTDIGGTLNNPGPAPQQARPQQPQPKQGGNVTPNGIGWSLN